MKKPPTIDCDNVLDFLNILSPVSETFCERGIMDPPIWVFRGHLETWWKFTPPGKRVSFLQPISFRYN